MIRMDRTLDDIHVTAAKMCALAKNADEPVEYEFNGIRLVATPTSRPDDVYMFYIGAHEQRRREYERTRPKCPACHRPL